MKGTTPAGARTETEAASYVRDMFGRVAPRYDPINHVLSLNIDRIWRRRTVTRVSHILQRADARVLDLCCGTGDLTVALAGDAKAAVMGSDFSHPMLLKAARKLPRPWLEADALALPFRDGSLDLITCAFGFRNLANYDAGLREFRRVLKPEGTLAILEFSTPRGWLWGTAYRWYSRFILPGLGGWISGEREAYSYLPESVRKFPDAPSLAARMREAGFGTVHFELWMGGIVALHLAT